jgi:signal peptidase I
LSVYFRKFRAYLKKNETARGLFLVGIVILGAVVVWEGIRFALNTDYPILVVSSGSMCQKMFDTSTTECTLAVGDLIVIKGQTPGSIQVPPSSYSATDCPGVALNPQGTIIVFHKPGDAPDFLIVHRVYRVALNSSGVLYYDTKGDSNNCADGDQIGPSDIKGVYQYTIPIPYLGSTILAIRDFMYNSNTGQPNPQGVLVIVALIVALFAFEVVQPSKSSSPPKATDSVNPPTPSGPNSGASSVRPSG